MEAAEGTTATWPAGPRPPGRRLRPAGLTRRQKYAAAVLLLAAATLPATRHAGSRPEQAANSPPPYPAQITHFRYAGTGSAAVAGGDGFVLRMAVRSDGPGPVELVGLRQSYRGFRRRPWAPCRAGWIRGPRRGGGGLPGDRLRPGATGCGCPSWM